MRGSIIKRGSKYSIVVYLGRINGKKKQKWYSGYETKKAAEKELGRILGEISTNTYVIPEKITVENFMLDWLEKYVHENLRETTYAGYWNYICHHIIPNIGTIKLQELKPLQIQTFYDGLIVEGRLDGNGGLSGKTVVQIHRILSKALSRAYKLQMITSIPTDFVEPPKVKKYKASVLKDSHITMMLKAFKTSDIFIPVLLGLNLGMRRGEVLGLKWQDVDFIRKTLNVNHNLIVSREGLKIVEPKSEGSKRTLLLSDSLIGALLKHKTIQESWKKKFGVEYNDYNLINCKPNGDFIHPGRFSKKFSAGLKKAELPHIRFHDLRHYVEFSVM